MTKDKTGRVSNVLACCVGVAVTVNRTNYVLSLGSGAAEPHPSCWGESSGAFRDMLTKQAVLAEGLAASISAWVSANRRADHEALEAMRLAARHYRAVARSLHAGARNAALAQGALPAD